MKTLAITGSTGKIGYEIVKRLARENYNLILINRNINKSLSQKEDLLKINPNINIEIIKADMSNLDSVFEAIDILKTKKYEYLILCSGIFNEKVYKLDSGYNNIFTVNFISQYLIAKSAIKYNRDLIKVVPVSSISYKFAKTNNEDIDYSNSNKTLKIYGNSKKFLMYSLMDEELVTLAHPGITYSNMTNHFHFLINWFIKFGMKVVFHSNKKAALNIVKALDLDVHKGKWVGPRFFDIWGKPKVKKLKIKYEEDVKIVKEFTLKIDNEFGGKI